MYNVETIDSAAGPCTLARTDRRTLSISVLPTGAIHLVAPNEASVEDIEKKVSGRLRWISRQRRAFAEMNRTRVPLKYESGATHRYLGKQYRLKVAAGDSPGVKLSGAYFRFVTKSGRPEETRNLLDSWMRARAVDQFSYRIEKWQTWCRERRLPEPRLRLLQMPKRWGSAHHDGRIYLNPQLVRAPSICIDYVITHEICHLKHPKHDNSFFNLLEQLCPDWRTIKAKLERLD
jgi:predicted metal-dependent hydrolase